MGYYNRIDPNYLSGEEKVAFDRGNADCRKSWTESCSTSQAGRLYLPPKGLEEYYQAGWKDAADKVGLEEDRKRGRQNGLKFIAGGVLLLVAGYFVGWLTYKSSDGHNLIVTFGAIGLGAVNVVIGLFMTIFGWNNE